MKIEEYSIRNAWLDHPKLTKFNDHSYLWMVDFDFGSYQVHICIEEKFLEIVFISVTLGEEFGNDCSHIYFEENQVEIFARKDRVTQPQFISNYWMRSVLSWLNEIGINHLQLVGKNFRFLEEE